MQTFADTKPAIANKGTAAGFETALKMTGAPVDRIATALPNFPSDDLVCNLAKHGGGNAADTKLALLAGIGYNTGEKLDHKAMYPQPAQAIAGLNIDTPAGNAGASNKASYAETAKASGAVLPSDRPTYS